MTERDAILFAEEQMEVFGKDSEMYDFLKTAKEMFKKKENTESHNEKHILQQCISLMQELTDEFAEWYRYVHGDDAIKNLGEEEMFCFDMTYFHIAQSLFLAHTNHSGGTSTRMKCKALGVDWSEDVEFTLREKNDNE